MTTWHTTGKFLSYSLCIRRYSDRIKAFPRHLSPKRTRASWLLGVPTGQSADRTQTQSDRWQHFVGWDQLLLLGYWYETYVWNSLYVTGIRHVAFCNNAGIALHSQTSKAKTNTDWFETEWSNHKCLLTSFNPGQAQAKEWFQVGIFAYGCLDHSTLTCIIPKKAIMIIILIVRLRT